MLEKLFKLKQNNTTATIEVIAGFTTFFTMAYIIFVNPSYLSGSAAGYETGLSVEGATVATCLAAAIGTLLIGLMSNYPFAQAPGMGLNSFFLFTMIMGVGLTWKSSFALIFLAGIAFILITASGLRRKIMIAIPQSMKFAITAGIGAFIAMLGLKSAGIASFSTDGVFLGALTDPAVLLALGCLVLMIILMAAKVKGAILIGIVVTTIVALFVPNAAGTGTVASVGAALAADSIIALVAFIALVVSVILLATSKKKFFGYLAGLFALVLAGVIIYMLVSGESKLMLDGAFFGGDWGSAFSGMFQGETIASGIITFIALLITLTMIDMFDTMGTLIGTAEKAGYLDENGDLPRIDRALYADAIATSVGALLGTSTVTTYVESVSGVNVGGRTGLTSVVVAGLFIAALVFTPIAGVVPSCATAPALVVVGILMMGSVKKIEWDDFSEAAPAFMTIIIMAFTSSITDGIGFGFITYCIAKIASKQAKKVSGLMYGIAIVFVIYYILKATVLG